MINENNGRFKKNHTPWNRGLSVYTGGRKFQKGQTPWNKGIKWVEMTGENHPLYGKHHSEESKDKMRQGHLGKKLSEEHKIKIGEANKGQKRRWVRRRPLSEETKKKISLARIERKKKFGYLNSTETKEKISKTQTGQRHSPNTEFKKGHIPWTTGRKMSEKQIEKLAQMRLEQSRSKEPTSIEKKLYEELKNRGLLFEQQKLVNGHFVVDAYIPALNLVIEADGDYWHSLPQVVKRDRAKNAYLTKCGFNLLRLSGSEINNDSFKEKLDKEVN